MKIFERFVITFLFVTLEAAGATLPWHSMQNWFNEHHDENKTYFPPWKKSMESELIAQKNNDLKNPSNTRAVRAMQIFFNQHVKYELDEQIYGKKNYWATLPETLVSKAADCKGFVIAKYFSLRLLGVPDEELRLVYVNLNGAYSKEKTSAHMVLAWYQPGKAEPLIADNLIPDLVSASKRTDLEPVFSFNSEGIYSWLNTDYKVNKQVANVNRLSHWESVLARSKTQGALP